MDLRGRVLLLLIGAVLCAIVAGGCGGSDSPDASAKSADESLPLASRPEIGPGKGLPPKKLVVRDLTKGTGKEAKKGDRIKLQYYGADWRFGLEHANSWHYQHIPIFTLGEHRLLRGLNQGIPGMKEGGGREIIIPYNLVYYPGGGHVHLGPLDTLIYKVYLVKVLGK
jgi:peptidylprolyl isomerase